ncbi:unnamed protein product [Lupinus luteus]|uniref:Uncharacterized protein n=1 Tax=Lupinus luteus TaxID=3873 RepID=A0AAV1VS54_LUPLU
MGDNFVFMAQSIPVHSKPPDKPPDQGDFRPHVVMKMSFRDKMLADSQPMPVRKEIDFVREGGSNADKGGDAVRVDGAVSRPTGASNDEAINLNAIPIADINEMHGTWLVVSRKNWNGKPGRGSNSKAQNNQEVNANRFNAFLEDGKDSGHVMNGRGDHNINVGEKAQVSINKKRLRIGNKEKIIRDPVPHPRQMATQFMEESHGMNAENIVNDN